MVRLLPQTIKQSQGDLKMWNSDQTRVRRWCFFIGRGHIICDWESFRNQWAEFYLRRPNPHSQRDAKSSPELLVAKGGDRTKSSEWPRVHKSKRGNRIGLWNLWRAVKKSQWKVFFSVSNQLLANSEMLLWTCLFILFFIPAVSNRNRTMEFQMQIKKQRFPGASAEMKSQPHLRSQK